MVGEVYNQVLQKATSKGHIFGTYCIAGYVPGAPNVEMLLLLEPGTPDVTEEEVPLFMAYRRAFSFLPTSFLLKYST